MLGLVQLFAEESEGERQIVMMMMMLLLMVTGKRMRMKMRIILMIMILTIVVFFCREKRGGDGDQESDKECPRNRRDAGCIWWSWRSPSFTTSFSISMFTGCPKKLTNRKTPNHD